VMLCPMRCSRATKRWFRYFSFEYYLLPLFVEGANFCIWLQGSEKKTNFNEDLRSMRWKFSKSESLNKIVVLVETCEI
jgi:hypothetical protein